MKYIHDELMKFMLDIDVRGIGSRLQKANDFFLYDNESRQDINDRHEAFTYKRYSSLRKYLMSLFVWFFETLPGDLFSKTITNWRAIEESMILLYVEHFDSIYPKQKSYIEKIINETYLFPEFRESLMAAYNEDPSTEFPDIFVKPVREERPSKFLREAIELMNEVQERIDFRNMAQDIRPRYFFRDANEGVENARSETNRSIRAP